MATPHLEVDAPGPGPFGSFAATETVAGGAVVVASPSGMWICRDGDARSVGLALAQQQTSDSRVVRHLLAGCLMAACSPSASRVMPAEERSLESYIFDLCLTYQTTTATPPTLRAARDRFSAIGDHAAADFAERKAVEETGHDRLALRDLEALGLPGQALVDACMPTLGRNLVGSFKALADDPRPYGVFGYAYVLERMAMMRTDRDIAAIQSLAPPGVDVTRCRRVHSAVGVDTDHVADIVDFTASLSVDDRQAVCRAVYQTARLMALRPDERDERRALDKLLETWRWEPFVGVGLDHGASRLGDTGG